MDKGAFVPLKINPSPLRRQLQHRAQLPCRHFHAPQPAPQANILKARSTLKSFEEFLSSKGSLEAASARVDKTRAGADKIGTISRIAGPAAIANAISDFKWSNTR
jgi:hypothetical protein